MVPTVQPVPAQAPPSYKAALDAAWESSFARLLEFKQRHGHFHVPYDAEHKSLHDWTAHQRTRMYAGTMPPERRQRLEAARFPDDPRLIQRRNCGLIWDRHFAELMDFYRLNGHFRVPQKGAQPVTLWDWVNHQRRKFSSGKLKLERRQKLTDAGFFHPSDVPGRNLGDPRPDDPWRAKYLDLAAFHKRFGHCYVPHHWPEQPGLGIWVRSQRRQRANLSAERIARLDEIHFIWTGGWEVLGEDWRQKQKEVMGRFYHDPETASEHYRIYRKPVVRSDEDDLESR